MRHEFGAGRRYERRHVAILEETHLGVVGTSGILGVDVRGGSLGQNVRFHEVPMLRLNIRVLHIFHHERAKCDLKKKKK